MSRVELLEEQIKQLSESELAEFRQWYLKFDGKHWDRKLEEDVADGRLDDLASEALEEYKSDNAREL